METIKADSTIEQEPTAKATSDQFEQTYGVSMEDDSNAPLLDQQGDTESSDVVDLHDAALRGDVAATERFLAQGALDLNTRKGQFLWTPLHLAVKYEHHAVAKLLVRSKAMLGIRDANEKTALEWAEHKIFLRDSKVIRERNQEEGALLALHTLLTDSVAMGTALYEAARSGELAVVELLKENDPIGIEAEAEALKRAAFFADVEALKSLMGCIHDEAAMLAIKYPLIPTAADTEVEPAVTADKLPMCQLICGALLEIACLNRNAIEREADKAPLELITVEVEMMGEGKLRGYKPLQLQVLKHAPVAELLVKAVLYKSLNEEWRSLLDRHQLTLDMNRQCSPMDITKRIDEYGLKNGDAILFVPSKEGQFPTVMGLSAAKRNLMLAITQEECSRAHAQVAASPFALQLPIEMELVKKRIDQLQAREAEQGRSCACAIQ